MINFKNYKEVVRYYFSVLSASFKEYFAFFPNFLYAVRRSELTKLMKEYDVKPSKTLEEKIKEIQKECKEIKRNM
jgi:hypothetical protein